MKSIAYASWALLLSLVACSTGSRSVIAPGARAPDFELPALDRGSVALDARLGHDVVLLDFWATFCTPCLSEMPGLDALYRRYRGRGFVVIGISVDDRTAVDAVRRATAQRASYPIAFDFDASVITRYDPAKMLPYRVLIGRDGVVISKRAGHAPGDLAALEREIDSALGVSARSPLSAARPTSASP